jgi:NAD(P)-dependent dehydrogenase (short-subunit alcohol dehydrogenase family)
VVSDVSDDAALDVVREITDNGGEAAFVHADVSVERDVAGLVDFAVRTFGRIDGAFNNAGIEQR